MKGKKEYVGNLTSYFDFEVSSDERARGKNMFYGAPPVLFVLAKKLRDKPTEAEEFLWKQLSNRKLGVRFKRQHPILYFIADFYCHKARLIIEVDGGYHKIPYQYEYDRNRDSELKELGLKVIRFSNEQVLFDINNTLQNIEKELETSKPINNERK
ncbi:MAG TPA: endonuclease domain-containing protein [Prolixibacteraceae bacterium]|nr:endonuclease domain-containing protein [Prolixibacteraceae bacterium]